MRNLIIFLFIMFVCGSVYSQVNPRQIYFCKDGDGNNIPGCFLITDDDGVPQQTYIESVVCSNDTLITTYRRTTDDLLIYVQEIPNAQPCQSDDLELIEFDGTTYLHILDMNGNKVDSVNLCDIVCLVTAAPDDDDIFPTVCGTHYDNVSGNDTPCDGGINLYKAVVGSVVNGTVMMFADGFFIFDFIDYGIPASFDYVIECIDGSQYTATVTLEVSVDNTATAVDDVVAMPSNEILSYDVSLNDDECDTEATTYEILTQSADGTAVMNSNGSFVFSPFDGFDGSTSFDYIILCGGCVVDTATVSVTVLPEGLGDFFFEVNGSEDIDPDKSDIECP